MRISGIEKHTVVNGPGIRMAIFFQGCAHKCPSCHNPDTWNFGGGTEVTPEEVIETIRNTRFLDGITLSGGDPMYQAADAVIIAKAAKDMELSVWCYTGFTIEEILAGKAGKDAKELLSYLDVLVDGPYVREHKPAKWRGSENQRVIDVKETLKSGSIVPFEA